MASCFGILKGPGPAFFWGVTLRLPWMDFGWLPLFLPCSATRPSCQKRTYFTNVVEEKDSTSFLWSYNHADQPSPIFERKFLFQTRHFRVHVSVWECGSKMNTTNSRLRHKKSWKTSCGLKFPSTLTFPPKSANPVTNKNMEKTRVFQESLCQVENNKSCEVWWWPSWGSSTLAWVQDWDLFRLLGNWPI